MKINIEISADRDRYYAKISGKELRSEDATEDSLRKLWLEILCTKAYTENDQVCDELQEKHDFYCAEEYYPDWPLSIAGILDIQRKTSNDGYYHSIDW